MDHTLNDIPGFFVGHWTDTGAGTGCTAIVCPEGATAGVDVAGGAPATRETDLLRPEEMVQQLHAVVLSGGSAFGLAAAAGAANELERRGVGFDMQVCRVPIVSSACLFDLGIGDASVRPGEDAGAAAVTAALDGTADERAMGNVGAGTGCTVGKFVSPFQCMKSGLGWAVEQEGPLMVGAIVAVNAVGSVRDPETGEWVAGARTAPDSMEIISDPLAAIAGGYAIMATAAGFDGPAEPQPRTNTTISCVITNALMNKAQCTKVAQMCGDAYARTIVPSHTTNDGDTVFVMANGPVPAPEDVVGVMAQQALARAIVEGCRSAESLFGVPGPASL